MLLLPFQVSGMMLAGFRCRRKVYAHCDIPRAAKLWLMAALMFGLTCLTGCDCFNPTFKTYTITVTGTSTLGGPPPQSATVQLSVGLQ